MHFAQEIDIYFRSRFTLIGIVSFEEERILQQLKDVCERSKRTLYTWDHADFFQPLRGRAIPHRRRRILSVSWKPSTSWQGKRSSCYAIFTSAGRGRRASFASCATWRRS
jgi:hypothetical protein